ncbi:hypothetical protein [Nostoc sp. 106C]|uniref:hypothetical protein n=1 Tax=Nostoc sp. 106C TaxID=1932667 RepID=UPI0010649227|nr:hypothetical protein [Nostoc sp. 106C]
MSSVRSEGRYRRLSAMLVSAKGVQLYFYTKANLCIGSYLYRFGTVMPSGVDSPTYLLVR